MKIDDFFKVKKRKNGIFLESRFRLFNIPARYTIEKARIFKTKGIFKKRKR